MWDDSALGKALVAQFWRCVPHLCEPGGALVAQFWRRVPHLCEPGGCSVKWKLVGDAYIGIAFKVGRKRK